MAEEFDLASEFNFYSLTLWTNFSTIQASVPITRAYYFSKNDMIFTVILYVTKKWRRLRNIFVLIYCDSSRDSTQKGLIFPVGRKILDEVSFLGQLTKTNLTHNSSYAEGHWQYYWVHNRI